MCVLAGLLIAYRSLAPHLLRAAMSSVMLQFTKFHPARQGLVPHRISHTCNSNFLHKYLAVQRTAVATGVCNGDKGLQQQHVSALRWAAALCTVQVSH